MLGFDTKNISVRRYVSNQALSPEFWPQNYFIANKVIV